MQAPDPEHVLEDEDGTTFYHWVASYEIDGQLLSTQGRIQ